MTTQEAEKLISEGWILKYGKDPFFHHEVWLRHPTWGGAGSAKYISHGVYRNLIKKGYESVEHEIKQ